MEAGDQRDRNQRNDSSDHDNISVISYEDTGPIPREAAFEDRHEEDNYYKSLYWQTVNKIIKESKPTTQLTIRKYLLIVLAVSAVILLAFLITIVALFVEVLILLKAPQDTSEQPTSSLKPQGNNCFVSLRSYGNEDYSNAPGGLRCWIAVNGTTFFNATYTGGNSTGVTRGVNTMILNTATCMASSLDNFDTSVNGEDASFLANYINKLTNGTVLLGVTCGEPANQLSRAYDTLDSVGVPVRDVNYNGKFAFVLDKGFPEKTILAKALNGGGDILIYVYTQDVGLLDTNIWQVEV